jgi:hypothetical protein
VGFRDNGLRSFEGLSYTSFMTDKKPLTDEGRQAFVNGLSPNQLNSDAGAKFEDAIARAAKQKQSEPETPEQSDGYIDRQTHSDTTVDTSD